MAKRLGRAAASAGSLKMATMAGSMDWSRLAGVRSFSGGSVARMPARFHDTMPAFKHLQQEGMWVEAANSEAGKR